MTGAGQRTVAIGSSVPPCPTLILRSREVTRRTFQRNIVRTRDDEYFENRSRIDGGVFLLGMDGSSRRGYLFMMYRPMAFFIFVTTSFDVQPEALSTATTPLKSGAGGGSSCPDRLVRTQNQGGASLAD